MSSRVLVRCLVYGCYLRLLHDGSNSNVEGKRGASIWTWLSIEIELEHSESVRTRPKRPIHVSDAEYITLMRSLSPDHGGRLAKATAANLGSTGFMLLLSEVL